LLGASAVQIATAIILNGYHTIPKYVQSIMEFMSQHNFEKISEFQGKVLSYCEGNTVYQHPVLLFDEAKCICCRKCFEQAFCTAITEMNNRVKIDSRFCDGCSLCVDLCPSKALYLKNN